MLSDNIYMELLDQECLEAHALSAISDQPQERYTINPCQAQQLTLAGAEKDHLTTLGLDVEIIYQRLVEFGSKALLYSYTDKLLCVVYYHETTDQVSYRGFSPKDIKKALNSYISDY